MTDTYKVLRDANGNVIAYGPNDDNYEPAVKPGQTLNVENSLPGRTASEVKKLIDSKRDSLLYTSIEVTFPGPVQKVIQYRNEADHRALTSVVQGAMANILAGNPSNTVKFRTEDNVTNTVESSDFVNIGMAVLAGKQALYEVAWSKKDAIDALDSEDPGYQSTLDNYDVDSGWS